MPNFVAVADPRGGIAGYVDRTAILDPDRSWPVYAYDLRTVVGTLVPKKGFVPTGVDPATVPDEVASVAPAGTPAAVRPDEIVLFVRNSSATEVWVAVETGSSFASGTGFIGEDPAAAGCYEMATGARLVVTDRPFGEPGLQVAATIYVREAGDGYVARFVDVDRSGNRTFGSGTPSWWTGDAPAC